MAIFGFICLVLIALWVTVGALAAIYGSAVFGGKAEPFGWVLAVIAAALWYAVWRLSPFSINIIAL